MESGSKRLLVSKIFDGFLAFRRFLMFFTYFYEIFAVLARESYRMGSRATRLIFSAKKTGVILSKGRACMGEICEVDYCANRRLFLYKVKMKRAICYQLQ